MKKDMNIIMNLRGSWAASLTAFSKTGLFDKIAQKKLTEHLISTGLTGLYIGGSTGEGPLMTVEERMDLLESVMEVNNGRVRIIVHIGCASTIDSVTLAMHAAKLGVDALSAVPCIYYKISEHEIEEHWNAIMHAANIPFIMYNIPYITGYDISSELLTRLSSHELVYGIKNTTMNAYQIEYFRAIVGNDFLLFNGSDEQYLAGLAMGADGGIGSTYGCIPELFVALYTAFHKHDMPYALRLQQFINTVIRQMYLCESFLGAAKLLTALRYTTIGNTRSPLAMVSSSVDVQRMQEVAQKIELFIAHNNISV